MNEQVREVRPWVKIVVGLLVLGSGALMMMYFMENPVEAVRADRAEFEPRVAFVPLKAEEYRVELSAQGQVEPVTQTVIISEVAGAIDDISPKLKAGGRFSKGEKMLKLSTADYQLQLAQANASVADAEYQLVQEEVRAVQSLRDWRKLGRAKEPGVLVTREPQLKSRRANLQAAKASAVQAERDLVKTEIRAPYDCMVAAVAVDAGGYLTRAGRVAEIYRADKVQVRLPMSLEDVSFLSQNLEGSKVTVRAEVGRESKSWLGKVVRTEGKIDRATHTMMVVVEISEADGVGMFRLPPNGLFVKGVFEGEVFEKVVKIPRQALRSGSTVWLVSEDEKLIVRKVRVVRSERAYVIVTDGLSSGERLITTPIELPVNGMKVEPILSQMNQRN